MISVALGVNAHIVTIHLNKLTEERFIQVLVLPEHYLIIYRHDDEKYRKQYQ